MSLVCCFGEVLLRLESPPNERLSSSSGLQASFAGAETEESAFSLAERSSFDWQSILECCDWFQVSGITPALSEAAAQATMGAIRCTVDTNTRIAFDFNCRAALWSKGLPTAANRLKKFASMANVLVASPAELRLMMQGNADADHTFESFKDASMKWFWFSATTDMIVSSFRISTSIHECRYSVWLAQRNVGAAFCEKNSQGIVDRVGSSDSMLAAVIDSVSVGRDLQEGCEFAMAATELQHSVYGDFFHSHRVRF